MTPRILRPLALALVLAVGLALPIVACTAVIELQPTTDGGLPPNDGLPFDVSGFSFAPDAGSPFSGDAGSPFSGDAGIPLGDAGLPAADAG
jgi:hypothetical protein